MSVETELRQSHTVCIQVSAEIDEHVATVWNCFLNDIGEWWAMAKFNATGGTMHLEPRAGGRLYEVAPSGHQLLWGTVMEILPQQRLFIHAAMGAPYAPACITLYQFNFESNGTGTRVSIRDDLFGNVDEKTSHSMTQGWTKLLNDGLKRYIELRAAE